MWPPESVNLFFFYHTGLSHLHEFESYHCLYPGVEEPEAEAWWELPEDHVLSGPPLLNLHETKDAKHRPGHGGKSQWPTTGPVQVSQRDEGPARVPDVQIRHVLPKELNKDQMYLSISLVCLPLLLTKPLLLVYLGCCVTRACATKNFESEATFKPGT